MSAELPEIVRLELPCDASAARIARKAIDGVGAIGSVGDDAKLVVTELVGNAVLHSRGAPEGVLEVCVQLGPDRLILSVHDPGADRQTSEPQVEGRPGNQGLGLRIVRQISHRCGAERRDGRRVWAELAL
jgi:anti-sigma regulatory factor (Ser/Thr protein kinase)